jgi:glycosyltransferase involved in cell wall biosynthesis
MKLLFVHHNLGDFGGAEVNIRICANELNNRGYRLALLYQETTGRNEAEWRNSFSEIICLPESQRAEFVRKTVARLEPDLVYLHNLSDLETLEALLNCGKPVIRMVHDHALYCMRGYKYNYFTRTICARPFSPFCLFPCLASIGRNHRGPLPFKWVSYSDKKREIALNKLCDRLVVYSDYLKQELVRNGFDANKIERCVPIRIQSSEAMAGSFNQRNLILFAGQLIRGKGVDVLLRALAKVRTHYECAIFGDGSHRHTCERLATKLGIRQRVAFHGYVLPAALAEFYREATVFVMGSLWPEPFGMAGPEAMRFGLPVVAFDAGGIREWLTDGENGFLIPWKNVDLFAARLEQLLRDKALARRLGRCALETVQRYDYGRQIDHLEHLMQSLTRGPGGGPRVPGSRSSTETFSAYE